jgi:hypothetical protein
LVTNNAARHPFSNIQISVPACNGLEIASASADEILKPAGIIRSLRRTYAWLTSTPAGDAAKRNFGDAEAADRGENMKKCDRPAFTELLDESLSSAPQDDG